MLVNLIKKGFEEEQKIRIVEEEQKLGLLRGGSSGAFQDGKFYGVCPRITLLRLLGLQTKINLSLGMIFYAGIAHEDFVYGLLKQNKEIKSIEREYQIEGIVAGQKWTGRIDFLVELNNGKKFIIETKALTSNFSANKINSKKAPFLKAILQCSMYKKMTGLEAYILYGHYFNVQVFKIKLNPIFNEFKVEFKENYIYFNGISTGIKVESLEEYYKQILYYKKNEELPTRALEKEFNGMSTYDRCIYCPFKDSCTDYDQGILSYDTFLEEIKNIIKG